MKVKRRRLLAVLLSCVSFAACGSGRWGKMSDVPRKLGQFPVYVNSSVCSNATMPWRSSAGRGRACRTPNTLPGFVGRWRRGSDGGSGWSCSLRDAEIRVSERLGYKAAGW